MESLNNIVNPVPAIPGAVPGVAGVLPVAPVPGALPVGYVAPVVPVAGGYVAPVANTVAPVAAVPAGYVPPAVAPAVPATTFPTAPVAVPGAPAGGGRLNSVLNTVRTASTARKNNMRLGTAIYLLKSGKYVITTGGKYKLTAFSVLCLMGVKDAQNIAYGTAGYSGPVPGETYETSMFQDMSPTAESRTIKNNLFALQTCMGWTEDRMKQYQATDEGAAMLMQLLAGMFCVTMDSQQPTGQPCCFSNQVVVQMSKTISIVPQKDAAGGILKNSDGSDFVKSYENDRWDKKVLITDLAQYGYTPETLVPIFGSAEAYNAALAAEQKLLAM